jgi:hypothetical protein
MNNVYKTFKFIPNAVSTGSNEYALYNGNTENNPNRRLGQFSPCPEANTAPETPALLILVARDYFKATNDIKTLLEINESLQHSMDIQLKHAVAIIINWNFLVTRQNFVELSIQVSRDMTNI